VSEYNSKSLGKTAIALNRNGSIPRLRSNQQGRMARRSGLGNIELKPGNQEFCIEGPLEPGRIRIVATVICSEGHEDMHMQVIVILRNSHAGILMKWPIVLTVL